MRTQGKGGPLEGAISHYGGRDNPGAGEFCWQGGGKVLFILGFTIGKGSPGPLGAEGADISVELKFWS